MSVFMTVTASMRWGRKIDENIENRPNPPKNVLFDE